MVRIVFYHGQKILVWCLNIGTFEIWSVAENFKIRNSLKSEPPNRFWQNSVQVSSSPVEVLPKFNNVNSSKNSSKSYRIRIYKNFLPYFENSVMKISNYFSRKQNFFYKKTKMFFFLLNRVGRNAWYKKSLIQQYLLFLIHRNGIKNLQQLPRAGLTSVNTVMTNAETSVSLRKEIKSLSIKQWIGLYYNYLSWISRAIYRGPKHCLGKHHRCWQYQARQFGRFVV